MVAQGWRDPAAPAAVGLLTRLLPSSSLDVTVATAIVGA